MSEISFPEGFDSTCTSEFQVAGKMIEIAIKEAKKSDEISKDAVRELQVFLMDDSLKLNVEEATMEIGKYFTIV